MLLSLYLSPVRNQMRLAIKRSTLGLLFGAVLGLGLFALNGLVLAPGETPVLGVTGLPSRELRHLEGDDEVRIVAYNIAKAFAYRQRLRFADPAALRSRLDALAADIRSVDPDLVLLSEVLHECPPCGLSQVRYLAEAVGAHAWLFGECYNIGLPFYRVSGGNAILSRLPIEATTNLTLVGRKPFFVSSNNRRALFGVVHVGGSPVLLGSLHNDSLAGPKNISQMLQILKFTKGQRSILGGDFNAWPTHRSLDLVRESKRFGPVVAQEATHPAKRPKRTIDYVVAPPEWEILEYTVLDSQVSDHRPVYARYRVPH